MKTPLFLCLLAAGLPAAGGGFQGGEDLSVFSEEHLLETPHFRIHHEAPAPPVGVGPVLENLHAKLFLELGAFAPWASQDKVDVYLYQDADHYHRATGMPTWAGAHIEAVRRSIYAHPRDDFQRVMAHEMGHLLFTPFFVARSTTPPLWLNEGIASLMEWDYGGNTDAASQDLYLWEKGPAPLSIFLSKNYREAGPGDGEAVALWYLQAGSVTRFLKRRFAATHFMWFCEALREGKSLDESLTAGYGRLVPNAAALDALWRADLETTLEKTK